MLHGRFPHFMVNPHGKVEKDMNCILLLYYFRKLNSYFSFLDCTQKENDINTYSYHKILFVYLQSRKINFANDLFIPDEDESKYCRGPP